VSKNAPQRSILTANRLGDGAVIFLDFEGAWSEAIDEALVALSPDEARALEDRGAYDSAHNLVVEPYLVEIREVAGRIEPIRYRERVRAGGPTILDDVPGYVSPEAMVRQAHHGVGTYSADEERGQQALPRAEPVEVRIRDLTPAEAA
jgi:hypothetical protein